MRNSHPLSGLTALLLVAFLEYGYSAPLRTPGIQLLSCEGNMRGSWYLDMPGSYCLWNWHKRIVGNMLRFVRSAASLGLHSLYYTGLDAALRNLVALKHRSNWNDSLAGFSHLASFHPFRPALMSNGRSTQWW